MMIEIPDPWAILSVILAFFVGLCGLYAFFKGRPYTKPGTKTSGTPDERLEYYERQLIDMKIRLDAMEMQGGENGEGPGTELRQVLAKLGGQQVVKAAEPEAVPEKTKPTPRSQVARYSNPTDHVLHLITDKAMTSRDIQVTMGKSREHISRLMKKLFEEGLVERNADAKPYTYSITEKGLARSGERLADSIAA